MDHWIFHLDEALNSRNYYRSTNSSSEAVSSCYDYYIYTHFALLFEIQLCMEPKVVKNVPTYPVLVVGVNWDTVNNTEELDDNALL